MEKFNRWTVLKDNEPKKGTYKKRVIAKCDCGTIKSLDYYSLKNNLTKSCGCERANNTKHSLSNSPEYNSWRAMKARCTDIKHKQFKDYGGRGITICSEWVNSFKQFYEDMGKRKQGTTLDRINNDKGYNPINCRWATPKQQSNNKRKYKKSGKI